VGAVVCASLLLAGCSDTVSVDAPAVRGADATSCAALVKALPEHVADQPSRPVEGEGYAAAWGDPAIVLRCGVGRPKGFDQFAGCQSVNGVDWYVPESQQSGQPVAITMTAVGRTQYVQVRLPEDYFPPATAMVDLAPAVKRTVRQVRPCV
jgi:hypothetical protein